MFGIEIWLTNFKNKNIKLQTDTAMVLYLSPVFDSLYFTMYTYHKFVFLSMDGAGEISILFHL